MSFTASCAFHEQKVCLSHLTAAALVCFESHHHAHRSFVSVGRWHAPKVASACLHSSSPVAKLSSFHSVKWSSTSHLITQLWHFQVVQLHVVFQIHHSVLYRLELHIHRIHFLQSKFVKIFVCNMDFATQVRVTYYTSLVVGLCSSGEYNFIEYLSWPLLLTSPVRNFLDDDH